MDEVHVSVAFSYDMERAEKLAEAWMKTGVPVKKGGPAFNEPDGAALQSLLAQERESRRRFPARSFGGCMRRLAANTKPSAVERLAAAKGGVKPPAPATRRASREAEL